MISKKLILICADCWGMAGVSEERDGSVYDPYDEQRLLEMEEGELEGDVDATMHSYTADDMLNSSDEEGSHVPGLNSAPSASTGAGYTSSPPATTLQADQQPPLLLPVPPPIPQPVPPPTGNNARVGDTTIVQPGSQSAPGQQYSTGTYARKNCESRSSANQSMYRSGQQSTGPETRTAVNSGLNSTASTASTTQSTQLPSDYLANKHGTRIRNGAPSLHDGSDIFRVENGSFYNPGDNRQDQAWLVFDSAKKINVSYSFDPETLLCACCKGGEVVKQKTAFVLTDQNFPAILPSSSAGGACLKIIRIEGGSLAELASLFITTFKNSQIAPGSVVLIGSATYLASVGICGYADEFVEACQKVGSFLGDSCVVSAVPMVMLDGSRDPALIRSIVETNAWLEKIFDKVAGFPAESHRTVIECLGECGRDGFQNCYSTRVRLPCNRFSKAKKTWACPSLVSLPEKIGPLPSVLEKKIVTSLLENLNLSMALDLDLAPNLTRKVEKRVAQGAKGREVYILVGSSHASRTATAMRDSGAEVIEATIPAWRPTAAQIDSIQAKLTGAIEGLESACVVFELFDNSFYYAQCDDGSLIPARKGQDGRYHVDGDSVLAPKETQFNLFKKMLPVFEAAKHLRRILVPPLPRYLHSSCCEDPEHVPNLRRVTYKEELINSVYESRTNIKDFAFRLGLRNVATISPWQTIKKIENVWGVDPIHMCKPGYAEIAKLIVEAASQLDCKRKNAGGMEPEAKRSRGHSNTETRGGHLLRAGTSSQRDGPSWRGWGGERGRGSGQLRGHGGRGRPRNHQWRRW